MKHVATQHISKYYPVEMFECEPIGHTVEGLQYEHGQWYVRCGGEGHYTDDMKVACEMFGKLVNFAINEARTSEHI